jgi:hypothetical protein
LFVIAVFSFAGGIYLSALFNIPLRFIVPPLIVILPFIPFLISKNRYTPVLLVLACFMLAGMARIGIATIGQTFLNPNTKEVYEGLVTETSPDTKSSN